MGLFRLPDSVDECFKEVQDELDSAFKADRSVTACYYATRAVVYGVRALYLQAQERNEQNQAMLEQTKAMYKQTRAMYEQNSELIEILRSQRDSDVHHT